MRNFIGNKYKIKSNFKGKTVVLTGAGMGLGLATSKVLAQKGANLSIVDYNEEALQKAKEEILTIASNVKILTIVADVSDEDAVKNYVAKTVSEFGTINGFYNNAGIEGKQAPLVDYDLEVFKKVIDINLMGVYYGLKHVIPVMQKNGGGKIVNSHRLEEFVALSIKCPMLPVNTRFPE